MINLIGEMPTTKATRKMMIVRIYSIIMMMSSEVSIDDFIRNNPCMIGDVLSWLDGNDEHISPYGLSDAETNIIILRNNGKNKPIEEQSKECIDFIYSLINQGQTQPN